MTKREICERLMEIRDQSSAGHLGPVGIRNALRDLILDFVVPDDHFADAGKKINLCEGDVYMQAPGMEPLYARPPKAPDVGDRPPFNSGFTCEAK